MNTYAYYIKAKAKSDAKSLFCWFSAKSDSRAEREIANILEDADIATGRGTDYQLPQRTGWHAVDDLPREGILDETWCERYTLSADDNMTWESIITDLPPATGTDTVNIASLTFGHRVLAHLLSPAAMLYDINKPLRTQICAIEMNTDAQYEQNLLLACKSIDQIKYFPEKQLWDLVQAIALAFPCDEGAPVLADLLDFLKGYVAITEPGRLDYTHNWIEKWRASKSPGAAASAGTPTPRPARGAPQNFRSLNIEIACALWPGDLDYHAIDARIINWAKKIINDDRKDWKRWSAVIHMQADILAYDRQTIFDMIRHAPDPEVCHQGNALKSYVADFLNQHGVRSEHTGEQNSGESHCGDEEHHEEATSNVQMEADRIDETQNDAGLPESQTGERPGKSHTAADLLPVTVATLPGHQPATCFNHLMVDIECMGRHPLAPVVAIAAVFFAPETGESGPEFYEVIDLHSAITCGGQPDGEAILWWLRQSSETRAAILSDTAIPLGEALLQFELFIGSHADGGTDTVQIWGNGAAFDNAIIRQSFVSAGLEPPWCFRNDRDVRTLVALGNAAGIDLRDSIPFEGVPHHALDDARHQVKYASAIWQRLMAH